MIYLDPEASRCYLDATKVMFHCDMVSWAHYLDRMVALRSMTRPNDRSHVRASRILSVEEWPTDDEWPDEELVQLVQKLGGTVAIFDHTAAELESVLKAAEHNIDNPGAFGAVVREMRRSGIKRGDISLKLSQYEANLDDIGVEIKKTPPYTEKFQISEQEMENAIQQQVRYRNPRALEFDINSVRSIFVLREGHVPRRLEDAKAVLVTANSALARGRKEKGTFYFFNDAVMAPRKPCLPDPVIRLAAY